MPYRGIYYLLPLIVTLILLSGHEMVLRKREIVQITEWVGKLLPALVPRILALTMLLSGIILLFTGATPSNFKRLVWLNDFLPLSVLEVSHFIGSLIGAALLFLSRGLLSKLDASFLLSVVLLLFGAVFSFLKGEFESSVILFLLLLLMLPCKHYFSRKTSLFTQSFTPAWIASAAIIIGASIWIGFFCYKNVEFSNDLWWRFTLRGDAPRFLRASVGAISLTLALTVARLLSAAKPKLSFPTGEEMEMAASIVEGAKNSTANLALLGDN